MKTSAGILLYRQKKGLEVLLVHPGGPFWTKKDMWGIPKGEYSDNEQPLEAAKREFQEEIGQNVPDGKVYDLGEIKISGGKIITAWAVEADMDVSSITSNTIFIDWPPRSGKKLEVPEVDKAAWMPAAKALTKMHKAQDTFVNRLADELGVNLMKTHEEAHQSSLF